MAVALAATFVFFVAVLILLEPVVDPDGHRAWARLRREARRTPQVLREGLRTVGRSAEVTRLAVAMAAGTVPLVVTEVLWQPKVTHLLATPNPTLWLGLLGAGIFAAAGLGSALAPRVGRWFGVYAGRAVVVLVAVMAAAQIGLALTGHLAGFTAVFLLTYLANGAWFPLHSEMTHDRVGDDQRTTVVSAMSMAGHATNIGAQVTLIPLAAATSPAVSWIAGAAIAVAGVLAIWRLRTRTAIRPGFDPTAAPTPTREAASAG